MESNYFRPFTSDLPPCRLLTFSDYVQEDNEGDLGESMRPDQAGDDAFHL